MAERIPPKQNAINVDLCDHWVMHADHRCTNYWRQEFVLDEKVEVGGKTMFGTYPAGRWRFCNTHARIFKRDRRD